MCNVFLRFVKLMLKKMHIRFSRESLFTRSEALESIENYFIKKSTGVLHIGGHLGQEAARYEELKAEVIWFEAIPDVHDILQTNIQKFSTQRSVCALLGDCDQDEVRFLIASNNSASSSLFNFGKDLKFKRLHMNREVKLKMNRLDSILTAKEASNHNHWVVDVQGAELLVLKGSGSLLSLCNSLLVEVSSREVYEGGAHWLEIEDFLRSHGFHPFWAARPNSHENILFYRIT
jgi:FkbM family methyltransferase